MNETIRNYPKFNEMYELCIAQHKYQSEVIEAHLIDSVDKGDWVEVEITQEEMDKLNAMSDVIQDTAQDIADELEVEFDDVWKELSEFIKEMKEAH